MIMDITSWDHLEDVLLKSVQEAMEVTVAPKVKQLQSENVERVVYDAYTPNYYVRRENNGGLSDVRNMEHISDIVGNSVLMVVHNLTMSNESYLPTGETPFEIAGVIEYGRGSGMGIYNYPYGTEASKFLKARQFIKKTQDDLDNGKLYQYLKEGLRKQGYVVR